MTESSSSSSSSSCSSVVAAMNAIDIGIQCINKSFFVDDDDDQDAPTIINRSSNSDTSRRITSNTDLRALSLLDLYTVPIATVYEDRFMRQTVLWVYEELLRRDQCVPVNDDVKAEGWRPSRLIIFVDAAAIHIDIGGDLAPPIASSGPRLLNCISSVHVLSRTPNLDDKAKNELDPSEALEFFPNAGALCYVMHHALYTAMTMTVKSDYNDLLAVWPSYSLFRAVRQFPASTTPHSLIHLMLKGPSVYAWYRQFDVDMLKHVESMSLHFSSVVPQLPLGSLESLPSLRRIRLDVTPRSKAHDLFNQFVALLSTSPDNQLEHVQMAGFQAYGDSVAALMKECNRHRRVMKYLNCSWCDLGDDGAQLASADPHCTVLSTALSTAVGSIREFLRDNDAIEIFGMRVLGRTTKRNDRDLESILKASETATNLSRLALFIPTTSPSQRTLLAIVHRLQTGCLDSIGLPWLGLQTVRTIINSNCISHTLRSFVLDGSHDESHRLRSRDVDRLVSLTDEFNSKMDVMRPLLRHRCFFVNPINSKDFDRIESSASGKSNPEVISIYDRSVAFDVRWSSVCAALIASRAIQNHRTQEGAYYGSIESIVNTLITPMLEHTYIGFDMTAIKKSMGLKYVKAESRVPNIVRVLSAYERYWATAPAPSHAPVAPSTSSSSSSSSTSASISTSTSTSTPSASLPPCSYNLRTRKRKSYA